MLTPDGAQYHQLHLRYHQAQWAWRVDGRSTDGLPS